LSNAHTVCAPNSMIRPRDTSLVAAIRGVPATHSMLRDSSVIENRRSSLTFT
jgi:hypothetical protein